MNMYELRKLGERVGPEILEGYCRYRDANDPTWHGYDIEGRGFGEYCMEHFKEFGTFEKPKSLPKKLKEFTVDVAKSLLVID